MATPAAELPTNDWGALPVRGGSVGTLVLGLAAVPARSMRHREPGPPARLRIRRSPGDGAEIKYYSSDAVAETPPGAQASAARTRRRVEGSFEDRKSYPGPARYEARSWLGRHHRMRLVGPVHRLGMPARSRRRKGSRS